ncbi:MAG: hypothetical protein U0164_13335 [Gemmatimonadaceae bacterium]
MRLLDLMLAPRLAKEPDQIAEWRSIARFLRGATVSEPEKELPPTSEPAAGTTPTADRVAA